MYFDKRSKLRELEPGDKVLVLLPTASNKLIFQWKGTAEVIERRGIVNYRVRFSTGQEKTFHINMLKRYFEREDGSDHLSSQCSKPEDEKQDEGEEIAAVMGIVDDSDDDKEDEVEASEVQTAENK